MSDYNGLATAVKDTIEADAYFADADPPVKTIEIGVQGFNIAADTAANFFRMEDLPGMSINAKPEKKTSQFETTNELDEILPVDMALVTRVRKLQPGEVAHNAILKELERVLNAQRTSSASFGIDAVTESVTTSTTVITKAGDFHYIQTFTQCHILINEPI